MPDLFDMFTAAKSRMGKSSPRARKASDISRKRKVAVIDYETDPFLYGRVPKPFCCEFYDGEIWEQFWGDDCSEQLVNFLERLEHKYLIYAHNGGKFDFHFLHKYVDNPALIIKSRIVEAKLFQHTLRDSYAILPIPLADYEKMVFDYSLMERPVREKHKVLILEYLHSDCVALFELVSKFIERFGPRMTIGGTAIKELMDLHPFEKMGSAHDAVFRPYYFGGRVQNFAVGVLPGPWIMVDVNSSFPASMKNKLHPINGAFDTMSKMPDNFDEPFFMHFTGKNRNAIPAKGRSKDDPLSFDIPYGEFWACSHELEIALNHGLIDIEEIHACHVAKEYTSFAEYVDTHFSLKTHYKEIGDKPNETFEKLLLNSAYGRTGINPENFEDWFIHRDFGNDKKLQSDGYEVKADFEDIELWARKAEIKEEMYCDVAIAASITSASRATLLEGLQHSDRPLYCDTDSIICAGFNGDQDKYRLGAWDLEKRSDFVAIGGKKLYAMYNAEHVKLNGPNPVLKKKDPAFKLSSKGGTLTLNEIIKVARGETVHYENMAPTFSLRRPMDFSEVKSGEKHPNFVQRSFKITGKEKPK